MGSPILPTRLANKLMVNMLTTLVVAGAVFTSAHSGDCSNERGDLQQLREENARQRGEISRLRAQLADLQNNNLQNNQLQTTTTAGASKTLAGTKRRSSSSCSGHCNGDCRIN